MNKLNWRIIVGIALILMGGFAILTTFDLIQLTEMTTGLFFAGLFSLIGLAFIIMLIMDRTKWWAAIPGIILFCIGLIIALELLLPYSSDDIAGFTILGGISLAFWVVYFLNNRQWWAIIPGGVMASVTIVTILEETVRFFDTGWVFLLGMGLTFALVALLPNGTGKRMTWGWYPAAFLTLTGIITLTDTFYIGRFVWPILIIAAGGYLVYRSMKK
jgi:hypothetical protein